MIVCICNKVSEEDIETCLYEGQTLEEIKVRLHIGEYCQKCLEVLPELFPELENNETY
jgi:bacterioferritin-associated ferredoxin